MPIKSSTPKGLAESDATLLDSPLTLSNGILVPNRLVKVAMSEHLSPFGAGPPNKYYEQLYSTWAAGGWGLIITGNVQVDKRHLGLGADLLFPKAPGEFVKAVRRTLLDAERQSNELKENVDSYFKELDLEPWLSLSASCHSSPGGHRPVALLQVCHTGRQSPRILGGRLPWKAPLAPSAIRVGTNVPKKSFISSILYGIIFQKPREMDEKDIEEAIAQFVWGAVVAWKSGWDGVQVHGSHGYLITQFMSPKTNHRTDAYADPLLFLKCIIQGIRAIVPRNFVIALKLNAADYVQGGMTEEQSLQHIQEVARWETVDLIEISGGDYENLEFTNASGRQAFFASFSRLALQTITSLNLAHPPRLILTGSLRGRSSLASAIRNSHTDLVGMARPCVVEPNLPHYLLDDLLDENDIPQLIEPNLAAYNWGFLKGLVGGSVGTMWYVFEMGRIARGTRRFTTMKGNRTIDSGLSSVNPLWRVIYCYFFVIWLRIWGL